MTVWTIPRVWRAGALAGFVLLGVTALAQAQNPDEARYVLNRNESRFGFSIGHFMVSSTEGRFTSFDGTLNVPRDAPERGKVAIHVAPASIDTGIAARDAHLRTADFFDVEKFPVASFESSALTRTGTTGRLSGTLTLHGVTRPVVLAAALKSPDAAGDRLDFAVTGKIKRSDFGMTNYQGMIGDEVTLSIEAVFDKAR